MSYNDIRYVNVEGRQIPVGHPNIVTYQGPKTGASEIDFFLKDVDGTLGAATGIVTVVAYLFDSEEAVTFTFSIRNACPVEETFRMTCSDYSKMPDTIHTEINDGTSSYISIPMEETVYFNIIANVTEGLVIEDDCPEGWQADKILDLKLNVPLKYGVDYGTSEHMNKLTQYEGRIFYVEAT